MKNRKGEKSPPTTNLSFRLISPKNNSGCRDAPAHPFMERAHSRQLAPGKAAVKLLARSLACSLARSLARLLALSFARLLALSLLACSLFAPESPLRKVRSGKFAPESSFRQVRSGKFTPESSLREVRSGKLAPTSSLWKVRSGKFAPESSLRQVRSGKLNAIKMVFRLFQ